MPTGFQTPRLLAGAGSRFGLVGAAPIEAALDAVAVLVDGVLVRDRDPSGPV
jgi:hypothetical protein